MSRLNMDPIVTLPDGSQLLVSTHYSREGRFTCGLYVALADDEGLGNLRMISDQHEAATCLEAQEIAYAYALRLYPGTAVGMKKPPYLVWQGPAPNT